MTSDKLDTIQTVARLTRRPQFLYARAGHSARARAVVIQARRRQEGENPHHIGAGFTATKKIGNAVVRNRAKRRLKAASSSLLQKFGLPGVDYVFIARRDTATLAWQRLLDDMETALVSLAPKLNKDKNQERA